MKRMLSGLMLPLATLACLAAWWALLDVLPACIYCQSGDVEHAPLEGEPRRYRCRSCGQAFTRADDAAVGFLEALEAMSRRNELYAH